MECGWEESGDVSNNVYMMVIMVIDCDVGGRMGGRSLENWEDLSLASGHSLHRLKLRPVFQNVHPARALGLLLADGAPTVGGGKTF